MYICILIHTYIEYLYTVCSKIGPKGVASKHHYTLFGMVSDTGFTTLIGKYFFSWESLCHWIGLRENRNRKPLFLTTEIWRLSCKFSLKPIQWLCVGNHARTDYGIPSAQTPYQFPEERFAVTWQSAIRVAAPRILVVEGKVAETLAKMRLPMPHGSLKSYHLLNSWENNQ